MTVNHKAKLICLTVAFSFAFSAYSRAQETSLENDSMSRSDTSINSALNSLKSDPVNAGKELLKALVPKVTQYAKEVGFAAVCNDTVVRKHHDDIKQVVSFVSQQTSDLVEIVNASFSDQSVAETVTAIEANEKEAVRNKIIQTAHREKIRSSIILAIYPLQKLIPFLKNCEMETLKFPTEIILKLEEMEQKLGNLSTHLLSKNWLIPAEKGSNLKELSENINKNMLKLKKQALLLQLSNNNLRNMVIDYLNSKGSSEEEKLKRELEALEQQLGQE